ncbi:hypothetical protein K490DRAFT_54863 [Saccharata proteae CBS 121410]|uniref:Uncharacterized protein n=1 Tax=Saccharata proteae CBS 121410 TaxID=1314787 RepID=A0A6A5YD24_9PEZI|nr:hypothetical protein K490DRAFT_54863 [Saccharata proteae CBS 121410]
MGGKDWMGAVLAGLAWPGIAGFDAPHQSVSKAVPCSVHERARAGGGPSFICALAAIWWSSRAKTCIAASILRISSHRIASPCQCQGQDGTRAALSSAEALHVHQACKAATDETEQASEPPPGPSVRICRRVKKKKKEKKKKKKKRKGSSNRSFLIGSGHRPAGASIPRDLQCISSYIIPYSTPERPKYRERSLSRRPRYVGRCGEASKAAHSEQ